MLVEPKPFSGFKPVIFATCHVVAVTANYPAFGVLIEVEHSIVFERNYYSPMQVGETPLALVDYTHQPVMKIVWSVVHCGHVLNDDSPLAVEVRPSSSSGTLPVRE